MEFWDNIIHTALLGTDKRQLKKEDFPPELAEAIELISQLPADKEVQFLNIASVAFNYRKCGVQPLNKSLVVSKAEAENSAYCSTFAHRILNDIIAVESIPLLNLWLELCLKNNQVVQPEWIPVLLDFGARHKQLHSLLSTVTGKRGKWLMQFNEAWKVEATSGDEDVWQTGTLNERKGYLQQLRTTEPAQARELLQQAWTAENANTKAELLKLLATNINDEDVPWLEQIVNEKSQKVKEEALRLLKLCFASSVVQRYWEIIKQSIQIKKERGILGIGSKTVLEVELVTDFDKSIFKSGIEKITSQKNVSDNDFILYQLIAAVPPVFFETHYKLEKKEIVNLFLHSKKGKQFLSAFGRAAITFKDADWLRTVLTVSEDQLYPEAFQLLSKEEKEKNALQFLSKAANAHMVLNNLTYFEHEWSPAFTRALLKQTVKNQYSYNRAFYNQYIVFMSAAITSELSDYAPDEAYMKNMWSKLSEYITQLLKIRSQTLEAFKP